RRASARAVQANRRGLPNDSRYSATARVAGSSYQYASRSLPLTSALLPSDTNVDTPVPVRAADSRIAMPTAPDWDAMASPPGAGSDGAKVALSRTDGSVLTIPRQFGPTRRRPLARASRTISACAAAPSLPVSARPEDRITAAPTPAAAQSTTTSRTPYAGTATTARSTGAPIAVTDGYAVNRAISVACGFTG